MRTIVYTSDLVAAANKAIKEFVEEVLYYCSFNADVKQEPNK